MTLFLLERLDEDGHFLQRSPPSPALLLLEGAGLVVVRSITSLAGDAGAHTGLVEPP